MNAVVAGPVAPATEKCHDIAYKGDMLAFYDCYLRKFNNKLNTDVLREELTLNPGETASLMVIDMQNDFIRSPVATPPGRFNVNSGENIIKPFADFIEATKDKFEKIIFTRDTHTIDHCSFGTKEGPFPTHCVANEMGAAFEPRIKAIGESLGEKASVVFKGCFSNTDSFGAYNYKNETYLKKRQLGKCCTDGLCGPNTGSFFLNDPKNQWEDFPFNFERYNIQSPTLTETECPQSIHENIKKDLNLVNKFNLSHIVPEGRGIDNTHYIFVMGLAGDYCVKDTALNLKKDIPEGRKIEVIVIQPLSRYAILPLQFVAGKQVYSNRVLANTTTTQFQTIIEGKDINHYLFKLDGKNFRLLTANEAKNAVTNNIIHLPDERTFNPAESNPNGYFAFLTPITDILNDYKTAGVKIVMTLPKFLTAAGGRRKRNNRNNRRKATRKQNNRKRQTYRRRR